MTESLAGKTIALLVANGFEEIEMTEPQKALLAAGAAVKLVSPETALVNGWHGAAWGHYFPVDGALSTQMAADFDALLVPGGHRSIIALAKSAHTNRFLKGFLDGDKPVVLVGDAATLLAGAERAAGRNVVAVDEAAETLSSSGATVDGEATSLVDGSLLTLRGGLEGDEVKSAVMDHLGGAGAVAEAA
ncbi:MAG: DJ-1/PfpI family protein [Pseudomonadota bacterium]